MKCLEDGHISIMNELHIQDENSFHRHMQKLSLPLSYLLDERNNYN